MVDIVLPPALKQARTAFEYVDPSGSSRSRYTGVAQTTGYGGDRVKASIDFTPCGGASTASARERAQLKAFLMALRGSQNRVWLTDVSSPLRGAFPASELFSNYDFSNGTTGWTVTTGAVSAVTGALRLAATTSAQPQLSQSVALTQWAPHVLRSLFQNRRSTTAPPLGIQITGSSLTAGRSGTADGYAMSSLVTNVGSSQAHFPIYFAATSGFIAGTTRTFSSPRCRVAFRSTHRRTWSSVQMNSAMRPGRRRTPPPARTPARLLTARPPPTR